MNRELSLLKYGLTRLALMPLMLWIIASMVFILLRIAPGDPVDAILGNRANQIAKEALRTKLGLDQPLWNQYQDFIHSLIHLDLGQALINQEPVKEIIFNSLPASVELSICSLIIAIIIGFSIGFSGIAKPEGKVDLLGRLFGISTYALPPFWAAMLVQLFFGVALGWLPVGGRFPPTLIQPDGSGFILLDSIASSNWAALGGGLRHLILPASTLGVLISGIFSRTLRLNLSHILNSGYIQAARVRGIKTKEIILKHAFRNALLPVLTIGGITIASLVGGALLIEITFSWPGIALRLQEAINQRDYPVVQGIVLIIATLVVLISVSIDILIAIIDPRVRY